MTTPEPLLIDTDVIIDYLRERPEAVDYIDNLTNLLFLSVITVGELYAGVRDGAERTKLDTFLRAFIIVTLDEVTAVAGGLLRRTYGRSHGTGLADALIAATAHQHKLRLVSLNAKHFPMLPENSVTLSLKPCGSSRRQKGIDRSARFQKHAWVAPHP